MSCYKIKVHESHFLIVLKYYSDVFFDQKVQFFKQKAPNASLVNLPLLHH